MQICAQFVEDLISDGQMVIRERIRWIMKNDAIHYAFKVPITLKNEKNDCTLELRGTSSSRILSYSYCVLMNKKRILALDPNKPHSFNLNGTPVHLPSTHKHKYHDQIMMDFAYEPTDIEDTLQPVLTLKNFLDECNIGYESFTIPAHPPIQHSISVII